MNEQIKNTAAEATDLLPIEREGLRKDAILDEFRQVNNESLRLAIQEAADRHRLKVELCLEALTGDFTGFRVIGENGLILTARYTYVDDEYALIGIDIADTRGVSNASEIAKAIIGDLPLRRTIASTLRSYELAAALYRA